MLPSVQEGGGGDGEFGTSVKPLLWRSHIKCMWLKFVHFHYSNRLEIRDKTGIWQWLVTLCFQNVSSSKRHYLFYFFEKVHCCTLSAPFWYICDHRNSAICCHRAGGAGPQAGRVNAHHSSLQCSIEILKRCSSSGETTPLAEPSLSPL